MHFGYDDFDKLEDFKEKFKFYKERLSAACKKFPQFKNDSLSYLREIFRLINRIDSGDATFSTIGRFDDYRETYEERLNYLFDQLYKILRRCNKVNNPQLRY